MKRLITLIISALLFSASVIAFISVKSNAVLTPSFGEDYTVLRLYDRDGFSQPEISDIRFAAENASTADTSDEGRLWCDAYSYFTEASASRGSRRLDCNVIVTGGDFFLFHPMPFKSGWYYNDTDLHPDRIVIDDAVAFELFGSDDVEDMTLEINGETLYVAGVTERDASEAKTLGLGERPVIYIPEYIAVSIFGERDFDYYEAMLQNPVKNHAVTALAPIADGKTVIDVTHRFDLLRIFSVLREFPTRSYRGDSIRYPYWENADRGVEDTLAVILVLSVITAVFFIISAAVFIKKNITERKKR